MRIRVPVYRTVGKSVRVNPDATVGAQFGVNLLDENGRIVTTSSLAAVLSNSATAQVQRSDTVAESQVINGNILARLADNETVTGSWTFNTNLTVGGNLNVAGSLAVNTTITNTVDDEVLTIFGGAGTGANIDLFGGAHPSLPNLLAIDADSVVLRDSLGTLGASFTLGTSVRFFDPAELWANSEAQLSVRDRAGSGVTSGAQVRDHGGTLRDVGFNVVPRYVENAAFTWGADHCGGYAYYNDTTAHSITMDAANADLPNDAELEVVNFGSVASAADVTLVSDGSTQFYVADGTGPGTTTSGNVVLGPGSHVRVRKYDSTLFLVLGVVL